MAKKSTDIVAQECIKNLGVFSEYSIDPNTCERVYRNVRIKTLHDTQPVLIEDVPGVLDGMGMTDARRKMDEAHNKMIRDKYNLALLKEAPYLHMQKDNRSPWEKLYKPETPAPAPELLQSVIDSLSVWNDEYRAAAKEYLDTVLPAAKAETIRLQNEVKKARADLTRITREQRAKVAEAEKKLLAFNAGIHAEVEKFEIANAGSRTPENFHITSENAQDILNYGCYYCRSLNEEYEGLQAVKDAIIQVEQELAGDTEQAADYLDAIRTDGEKATACAWESRYMPGQTAAPGTNGLMGIISGIFGK